MNEYISPFSTYNSNRIKLLGELKEKTGRVVFGYFCSEIPEEIIYAAGILPVRILGNDESSEMADSLMQTYFCSFSRNCLAMMIKGDYKFLDGMIAAHTCDTIRGLFAIAKRNIPVSFKEFIRLPITLNKPQAKPLILEEYKILKSNIERHLGIEIRKKDLKNSIAVYNSNRRLLGQLSKLRIGEERRLTGAEFLEVCLAGFSMDKEEHSIMMRELLKQIQDRKPLPPGKVKVLIAGNVLDSPVLIKAIEDLGADVVYDDLCTGTRYFHELVDEKTDDPMEAIVNNYLARTFCPCKVELENRIEHLMKIYKDSCAQGIILLQQKFCDPHLWDYPLLKKQVDSMGIPLQLVEYEQPIGSLGTVRNRIQSLIEMIGG